MIFLHMIRYNIMLPVIKLQVQSQRSYLSWVLVTHLCWHNACLLFHCCCATVCIIGQWVALGKKWGTYSFQILDTTPYIWTVYLYYLLQKQPKRNTKTIPSLTLGLACTFAPDSLPRICKFTRFWEFEKYFCILIYCVSALPYIYIDSMIRSAGNLESPFAVICILCLESCTFK